MLAIDLISSAVPVLSPRDSPSRALELMNEFHTSELPMVEGQNYLGLMEEESLLETEITEAYLSGFPLAVFKPAVQADVHFFEAIKIIGDYKLSLLPVVDQKNNYAGAITSQNLLNAVSRFNGIQQPGGILVLSMKPQDYMLSEIARLAEAEDIFLLGVHTLTEPESGRLKVILKTNRQNLDPFIASLRQLDYEVIYRFDITENTESLQRNYDNLMNYINM